MSINIKRNNVMQEVSAVADNGYYYIVKKGGASKVYQPGTRGSVYCDCTKEMMSGTLATCPKFGLKSSQVSSTPDYVVTYVTSGYAAIQKFGSVVRKQLSNQHLLNFSPPNEHIYVMPCDKDGWSMTLRTSGDKPVSGYSIQSTSDRVRLMQCTEPTYKTEYHVVVSVSAPSHSSITYDPNDLITSVRMVANYSNLSPSYKYEYVVPCVYHRGRQHLNMQGIGIYKTEIGRNFAASYSFSLPIFEIETGSASLISDRDITFKVQTIIVFKDD